MVYTQPRICPGEWHAQTSLGFRNKNGSANPGQETRPYNNQQERKNMQECVLYCPGGPQSKIKRIR